MFFQTLLPKKKKQNKIKFCYRKLFAYSLLFQMNMSLSRGKSPSSQISLTLKIMRRYPKEENDTPLATEALDHELWSYTDHEKARFLNPHTCDILRQTTLCCGGLSCALQDVESIPDLYPLDASSTLSQVWTKNACRHYRKYPVENYHSHRPALKPGCAVCDHGKQT